MACTHSGPVQFEDEVSYRCKDGFYFEENREKVEHLLWCQTSGFFNVPVDSVGSEVWPKCVESESGYYNTF